MPQLEEAGGDLEEAWFEVIHCVPHYDIAVFGSTDYIRSALTEASLERLMLKALHNTRKAPELECRHLQTQ